MHSSSSSSAAPAAGSTCVVDGVSPQQMCNVMSPGGLLLPVLGLQHHAVSGASSLPHPDFELDAVFTHVLSETHLTCLPGGCGAMRKD